jgi:uncharacterized membrane protein
MARTEQDINNAEWHDPRNWHGGWLGLYSSSRDTRMFVPKRQPWMGFTVNFARPSGVLALLLIVAVGLAVVVVALLASA